MGIKELIKNDYKEFKDHFYGASRSFQRKVCDNKGIKYFINIYEWDFSEFKNIAFQNKKYETKMQLISDGACFDICILHTKTDTLEEIEELCEKFWTNMNCQYYEKIS